MNIRTGVDLCDPQRIEKAVKRHGTPFLKKVFTSGEITYCQGLRDPYPSYAARWAAKEAVMKLLGGGIFDIGLTDIEVVKGGNGRPTLLMTGRAKEMAEDMGIVSIDISISHERGMAVGIATCICG